MGIDQNVIVSTEVGCRNKMVFSATILFLSPISGQNACRILDGMLPTYFSISAPIYENNPQRLKSGEKKDCRVFVGGGYSNVFPV
jgi:hypothetical protein